MTARRIVIADNTSRTKSWPARDPDDVLDYSIDWTGRLAENDWVSESTWHVPEGLTMGDQTKTLTTTTLWLSGGVVGRTYSVRNTVATSGGRTLVQTVSIEVMQR